MMSRQQPADDREFAAVAQGKQTVVNYYALPNGGHIASPQKALVQRL